MRGQTLTVLVSRLKALVGDNLDVGTQMDSTYKALLASKQKQLAGEFAHPFLELRWDVAMVAATKTYSWPTTTADGVASKTINQERQPCFFCLQGTQYVEMPYGISAREFNNQTTGEYPERWAHYDQDKFEVWPTPTAAHTVRIFGQRVVAALVADGDTADLDDELLTLSVALDLCVRRKDAGAQTLAAYAQQRLRTLRAQYPRYSGTYVLGQGDVSGGRKVDERYFVKV